MTVEQVEPPSASSAPVLIIGAGLSGLFLAQGLLQAGIPCVVYERQERNGERDEGYRIRLNPTVVALLKQWLPMDIFNRFTRALAIAGSFGGAFDPVTGGEREFGGFRVPGRASHENKEGLKDMPPGVRAVERALLRDVLLTGLEDVVTFGHEFSHFSTSTQGVQAHFTNSTISLVGSLLVGADGPRSQITAVLAGSPSWRVDSGLKLFFGRTHITPELESNGDTVKLQRPCVFIDDTSREVEPGITIELIAVFSEPMRYEATAPELPSPSISWNLGIQMSGFKASSDFDPSDFLSRVTSTWTPDYASQLGLQQPGRIVYRPILSADPNGLPQWPTHPWVTVIGDALHPMMPYGGHGANAALSDAAVLLENLTQSQIRGPWPLTMIQNYETKVREDGLAAVKACYNSATKGYGFTNIPLRQQ